MKTRAKQKIHQLDLSELNQKLNQSLQELMAWRLQKKAGKLKDLRQPFKKRKEIALLKTIITEKLYKASADELGKKN